MAQMSTFMKDLTGLDDAIASTLIPADFDTVQKFLATQASMTTALNGLPAEYARAYLQVQTLKYDENNDPVDVTAEEALSIPESVIARYKQSWGNLNNTLEALRSRLETAEISRVSPVPEGRQVIEFTKGSDCWTYVCDTADYNSLADLLSGGSEMHYFLNRLNDLWSSFPATFDNSSSALNALITACNLVPSVLCQFTLDDNLAARSYAIARVSIVPSTDLTVSVFVQARGKFLAKTLTFPNSTSKGDHFQILYDALLNGGTGWVGITGSFPVDMPKSWSLPSSEQNVTFYTNASTTSRAVAPGGLDTQAVDKIAVEIDLSDLDTALSAL